VKLDKEILFCPRAVHL